MNGMFDQTFWSLAVFALVGSITPGPNVMMSAALGARFGFLRTVPQVLGIGAGFGLLLVAVGAGFGALFAAAPWLHQVLKFAGSAYMLLMAYKLARAGATEAGEARTEPMGFVGSSAFQWINPKAWALALSVIPAFTTVGGDPVYEIGRIVAVFAVLGILAAFVWAAFGAMIAKRLRDPATARRFNIAMAIGLALSIVPLLL